MKKLSILIVLVVIFATAGYFFLFGVNADNAIAQTTLGAQMEVAEKQNVEHTVSAQVTVVENEAEKAYEEQVFIAGKHYVVINKPVETETGDKVEVRELFWYYCSHCYNLEPYIHEMEANLTDKAEFVRQPAVFSERWEKGAIFYYILKHLGEFDRLNTPLFSAIHRDGIDFNSQEDFVNWLNINGVDMTKANDAFKQYSVAVNVNKAKANSFKYQAQGVPTLVVNGKYWVDAAHAGSIEGIFKVVDYLIEKELAEEKEAIAKQLTEESRKKKEALDAELIVLKEKFEGEQNVRALITEIQAEEDADRKQLLEDILSQLKANYIGLIAGKVRKEWRYQGAEDYWGCNVHIIQSEEGHVLAANIQNCTIDNSDKAISFKNSIERAVYKASPLPLAPDKDLFETEIMFHFRVNQS